MSPKNLILATGLLAMGIAFGLWMGGGEPPPAVPAVQQVPALELMPVEADSLEVPPASVAEPVPVTEPVRVEPARRSAPKPAARSNPEPPRRPEPVAVADPVEPPLRLPPDEPEPAPVYRDVDEGPVVVPAPSRPRYGQPVADPVPVAPRVQRALIAEGTVLEIRLAERLSTESNEQGDPFQAVLDRDLVVDGKVVAPKRSRVFGKITELEKAGKVQGTAKMAIVLSKLQIGEETYPIETNTISFEAEKSVGRDAKVIGGAAGIGALIGAIAGGKKGAAVGATVGGGAGTAAVLATEGKPVEFESEHKLSFRLEQDLEVRVR